jgi:hypothetical protein
MKAYKKKIAAMTAVLYYLQDERQASERQIALLGHKTSPPSMQGFWRHSTRHAEMLQRSMLQMRQIPGWNK